MYTPYLILTDKVNASGESSKLHAAIELRY